MTPRAARLTWLLFLAAASRAWCQEAALPPGDKAPVLRLEAGGPTSYVTGLAFGPGGKKLYAAGQDKVVRVWSRDDAGRYRLEPETYRVPLGPGLSGALNALTVSADGNWLAVAGRGVFRGQAGFRQAGFIWPGDDVLTDAMRRDQGLIYVFNTNDRSVRLLRGHTGAVLSLQFVPRRDGKPLLLVSAALEWNTRTDEYDQGAARLWDVEKGSSLAEVGGLPKPQIRPSLSPWHTGDGVRQVRVALGWGDRSFRLWDASRDRDPVQPGQDVQGILAAVHLPGRRGGVTPPLLSAGSGVGQARLKQWQAPAGRPPRPVPGRHREGKLDSVPLALELLSSRANGRVDHAAVVVYNPTRQTYRLQVFGLDNLGVVKAERELWKGSFRQPALATAPDGKHLAIAGNDAHEVHVFAVADLLRKGARPQVIRGVGSVLRHVSFARKGQALALLLNEQSQRRPGAAPRDPKAGDLLFDFNRRALTDDLTGWRIDTPDLGQWRAEADEKGLAITIRRGRNRVAEIKLPKEHLLSDFALLPPRPPLQVPILAVASHRRGQPTLALYNAATGEQVRQLSAHQDRLCCLAFSSDGRLLASAAEDQTVCVWALTDLDRIIGKHGQLKGVAVKEEGGALRVSRVADDSPSRGRIKEGEVVEGLVQAGKLQPFDSRLDFYFRMLRFKPGEKVTLRVRGDRRRDVDLPVAQAVDDRKPLFSLFVTDGERPRGREWIGWNPIGPYDCSGQRAERHLGWHVNTGDAKAPTSFATADQYRKEYYREGLLKELVAKGELPPKPPERLPPPRMGLLIEEAGEFPAPDGQGQYPVRQSRVTLRVSVGGRPLDTLASVAWQVGDAPEVRFDLDKASGRDLSATLELKRGVHRVRVVARTRDDTPREYTEELLVRYQPPPPRVEWKTPEAGRRLVVKEPELTVAAVIRSGLAGERVRVTLLHRHQGRELPGQRPRPVEGEFRQKVKLEPGDNTLELIAVNADALNDHEDAETTRRAVVVNYQKKDATPLITLKQVVPLPGANGDDGALGPNGVLIVHEPRVRIEGAITAEKAISRAEWLHGEAEKGKPITGFMPGKRTLAIKEIITLEPGTQTIRFVAQTANSDLAGRTLTLEYRPRLPLVEITEPAEDREIDAGKHPRAITVKGRFIGPGHKHAYKAMLLVNGKETKAPNATADGRWSATVPLEYGANRIEVRLSNRWKMTATHGSLSVRYVRPPRVIGWDGPPANQKKPVIDLVARVESALPLLADSARAEVNGRQLGRVEIDAKPVVPGTWAVRLKGVALEKGTNVVTLSVSNREARTREKGTYKIDYAPPAPPMVELIAPRVDGAVTEPEVMVRFQVKSASRPQRLEVIREGAAPWRRSLAVESLKPDARDFYTPAPVKVPLLPGDNRIRVEAVNEDGADHAAVAVSYTPPPVRLEVTHLTTRQTGDKRYQPRSSGGELLFDTLPKGRVRLHGVVRWSAANDARLKKTAIVRVYVNGIQQLPAVLQPPKEGGRERKFEANLLLDEPKDNQIELALPDLPGEASSRTHFALDCENPERVRRLHLLIVGAKREDEAALKKQFLDVFRAKEAAKGVLKTNAFERVFLYGPLVGFYSRPEYVNAQLEVIRNRIKGYANAGAGGVDVVVFYFKGGESVNEQGHFFQAGGQSSRRSALTCSALAEKFADTPGGHVLLFDVDRLAAGQPEKDQVARWPDLYSAVRHVAVLRFAWVGEGEAPAEARLLRALQGATAEVARLFEVSALLGQFRAASMLVKSFQFDRYLPTNLKRLELLKH